jgi:Tfp pilus assembly protein PilN
VHHLGAAIAVVVVERAAGAARVAETATIDPADHAPDAVRTLIETHQPDRVIRVARAGDAVCRTVEAPRDDRTSVMLDTFDLLAEAELPESTPPWRRGAALLGAGATAGMQAGLLVALPEDRSPFVPILPDGESESRETIAVEPFGAAAFITPGEHAAAPPAAAVCFASPTTDSIAIAASGAHHAVVRSIREPGDDAEAFLAEARRAFDAARRRVHLPPDDPPLEGRAPGDRRVLITIGAADRFAAATDGAAADPDWIAAFGAAAAIGITAVTQGVRPGGSLDLRDAEPIRSRSIARTLLQPLATPRNALALAALAVVLISFIPTIAAWVRMNALEQQAEQYQTALGLAGTSADDDGPTVDDLREFYRLLDETRIPMTKALADLAAALPAESETELARVRQLSLEFGEGFQVSGITEDRGVVAAFTRQLDGAGVFDGISIERVSAPDQPGAPVEFDVSGRFDRPFAEAKALRNYAEHPAADFIYGVITDQAIAQAKAAEEARRRAEAEAKRERQAREAAGDADDDDALARADNDDADAATDDGPSRDEEAARDRRRAAAGAGSRRPQRNEAVARSVEASGDEEIRLADDEEREASRRRVFEGGSRQAQEDAGPEPVPEELTDEQIAAMGQLEAVSASIERSRVARNRDDLEPDVVARLKDEARRLRDRAREAKEEGG